MKWFKNILRRILPSLPGEGQGERLPLRIEGIAPAPMTPEPDEAELAVQALLEMMAARPKNGRNNDTTLSRNNEEGKTEAYYNALASRIRKANDAAVRRTMRFLTFCEQELEKQGLPVSGDGSLRMLEAELYKRIDTVERVGGELKSRWQHCLADVTVRLMNPRGTAEDEEENKV